MAGFVGGHVLEVNRGTPIDGGSGIAGVGGEGEHVVVECRVGFRDLAAAYVVENLGERHYAPLHRLPASRSKVSGVNSIGRAGRRIGRALGIRKTHARAGELPGSISAAEHAAHLRQAQAARVERISLYRYRRHVPGERTARSGHGSYVRRR